MRDYLVLGLLFAIIPYCLVNPYVGLLTWSLFGYMNPHRLTWGIAYNFPVVMVAALATLAGLIFHKKKQLPPPTMEVALILTLCALFTVTSYFSFYPELAWNKWNQVMKTMLLALVTMVLVTDKERLRGLFWVITISIGFYGAKGGLFSVLTGGNYLVWGPPDTSIAGNTSLGVAMNMALPIFFFMAKTEEKKWHKRGLWGVFWLTVLAVIFTYSRGAFLGLIVVMGMLFLKARRKFVYIALMVIAVPLLLPMIPETWYSRIETIKTYEQDESAMARINEWKFARNLAADRPLIGGGFKVYSQETYDIYLPEFGKWWDSHSIYFGMLAEHGYTGFILFVFLLFVVLLSLQSLKRHFDKDSDEYHYAQMITISMMAYMVSGAFLDLHYLDLFYQLVAAVVVLKGLMLKERKEVAMAKKAQEFNTVHGEELFGDNSLNGGKAR